MKQKIMTLLLMTALTATFVSCDNIDNYLPEYFDRIIVIEGQGVQNDSLKIWPGERVQLTGDIQPHYTKEGPIVWSSSDESIATVDASTGEVVAVAAGVAIIKAVETRENVFGKGQILVVVLSNETPPEPLGQNDIPLSNDEVSQGLAEAPRM